MKKITKFTLVLSLLLYGLPGMAAGEMHGAYVQIKFSGTGILVNTNVPTIVSEKRTKIKGTCYTRVIYDISNYEAVFVCETAPDVWVENSGVFLIEVASPVGGGYSEDNFVTFTNANGQVVEGYGTHYWKPKLKNGELKNITARSLGGEMISSSTANPAAANQILLGEYSYKGKMIKDPTKIPAGAFALLPLLP